MHRLVDKAWTETVDRAPMRVPVIVETDLWSQIFAGVPEVLAWKGRMGSDRMVVTHATVREISFGAHWRRPGSPVDAAFDAELLAFAAELPRTHPYLPLSDPGLISEGERLRADARLKNLWITDDRCGKPRSAGRIEVAAAALYLGLPIASRGLAAYRLIASCGYPLPLVYDPITGTEAVRDGRWLRKPEPDPS